MEYVGIDLGTSNSNIAWSDGKSSQIIEMADGSRALPSVITFDDDDNPLVGTAAVNAAVITPTRSYRHVKRLVGQKWNDAENSGGQTVEGPDGSVWLRGPDKNYSPTQFQAVIIDALLNAAENKFGKRPQKAVLTVPAAWKTPQRDAAKGAALMAGLTDVTLLPEPNAAAIAYGVGRKKFSTIAVYDWGGGTFDFSIIRAKGSAIEEVGTSGNAKLGGKDVDEIIVRHVLRVWHERYGTDLGVRNDTMPRIRTAAEATKIELTGLPKSAVKVDFVDSSGPDSVKHMNEPITKDQFEEMAMATVMQTFGPVEQVMKDCGIAKGDIDEIILVGGMTRVPMVRQLVADFFGKEPKKGISPEEVVALGAATYAAQLAGRGGDDAFSMSGKAPHSLSLETLNNERFMVIQKGTPLPAKRVVQLTTSVDNAAVVGIHLLEGDDEFGRADELTLLCRDYPEVEPSAAGEPTVEIVIERDESGGVRVTHNDRVIYEAA